jgi:hypothetical protein
MKQQQHVQQHATAFFAPSPLWRLCKQLLSLIVVIIRDNYLWWSAET